MQRALPHSQGNRRAARQIQYLSYVSVHAASRY
nr:MAG TPA: hypothetical protein [Bacteriophage sp.]